MSEQESKPAIYDKTGREIIVGDVLKVYHFTAALRRKRHYMYKQAVAHRPLKDGSGTLLVIAHLNMADERYYEMMDGRVLGDYEIVQSIDARFDDRPKTGLPATPPAHGERRQ